LITNEETNKSKFERMLGRHSIKMEYKYQNGATVSTFKDTSMTMIAVPCHPRVIMTGKDAGHAFIIAKNFRPRNDKLQLKLEDF
jgi:hypothetical protein